MNIINYFVHNNNGDIMKNKSIWEINSKALPPLDKNISTDILIIGGGMAGMSTAYHLKESNNKIVLIDRDTIGNGVTKKTTGKLTFLQNGIYPNIASSRSEEDAKEYFYSQKDAIKIIKDIISSNKIDCDLLELDSYLFAHTDDKEYIKEKEFLDSVKEDYKEFDSLPIAFPCKKALSVSNTYTFHPLKFLNTLKEIIMKSKIKIYENTKAIAIDKEKDYYVIHTEKNKINAKKVIVTTHYPFFVLPALLPLSLKLEKSYLLDIKKDNEPIFTAISTDAPNYTFRIDKKHFIFGGNSHNLATNLNYKENHEKIMTYCQEHIKKDINYFWSTHDMISKDHLPMIGSLNKDNPNLYIATAFHKWGMTNGILSGKILSDLILEKENKYSKLFKPDRFLTPKTILNKIGDNAIIDMTYISTKINKEKSFYHNIKFDERDGLPCATYTDESGKEHTVINRCPHLKCGLIFNELDKTWDCPCHGSRFNMDGKLIQGPSVYDIIYEKKDSN